MQKYILGADPSTRCAIIRPFDDNGNVTGEWEKFNAGIIYKASEADAAIAAKDARIADYERVLRECLRVFADENFTDRYDHAGMIRTALAR